MIHITDRECPRCRKEKIDSIAYIPNLGEVCINCYLEYIHICEQAHSYNCEPIGFN